MTIVKKVRLLQQYQDCFEDAPLILPGTYTVRDYDHHSYQIVDKGFLILKGLCEDVETEEYATEYVINLEQKLVDAGKELVREREEHNRQIEIIKRDLVGVCSRNGIELGSTKGMIDRIGKFIDDKVARNIANEMKLNGISEILTEIDKEQGGFEVNPEYPIGSMDTIRAVLQNWRKEMKRLNEEVFQRDKEHSEVMDYLKTFLSGLGYETKGWADTEIADTLEDVLRDMKPIKQPVKVPADVAQALEKLYTRHDRDVVHGQILQRLKVPASFLILTNEDGPLFATVSKWRQDGNATNFTDLMKYGYVAEKSEREQKIEEIAMIMMDTHKNTTKELAEIVYDKFVSKGEQQ